MMTGVKMMLIQWSRKLPYTFSQEYEGCIN